MTKTDLELKQEVQAELDWEPSVDASRIAVLVREGVVTLTGQVASVAGNWGAELAVRRVGGVREFIIELAVCLPAAHQRADADIARDADAALRWTHALREGGVGVQVEEGRVILTGTLRWEHQRQAVLACVRDIRGVVGLSDHIGLLPETLGNQVKADIEAALRGIAAGAVPRVVVEVQGNDITLRGSVHSQAERMLVRHSAWSTPGVRHVFDRIEVNG